jgi:hypothetical protein
MGAKSAAVGTADDAFPARIWLGPRGAQTALARRHPVPTRTLGHAGTQYLEFENGDVVVQFDFQERVTRVTVRPPAGPGAPNWLIGAALALLATYTGYHWWRNRPVPAGLCPVCEYDLRGNISGRCPECGTAVGEYTTRGSERHAH